MFFESHIRACKLERQSNVIGSNRRPPLYLSLCLVMFLNAMAGEVGEVLGELGEFIFLGPCAPGRIRLSAYLQLTRSCSKI